MGFDQEPATVGHGIAGIDHQVEQGAFDLMRVGFGHPQILTEVQLQLDALIEAALQEFAHGGNQRVHFHRLGVQRLTP
ncbi:hypothetical protein D9M73_187200 [compost metagenome]